MLYYIATEKLFRKITKNVLDLVLHCENICLIGNAMIIQNLVHYEIFKAHKQ